MPRRVSRWPRNAARPTLAKRMRHSVRGRSGKLTRGRGFCPGSPSPAAAARTRGRGAIDVYVSRFKPLKHTLTGRDERTMMKLVVDAASGRVLGCHMVGADAPEIVQGFAVALKCGATKAAFDATVGIHPTAAEEFVTMREKRRAAG